MNKHFDNGSMVVIAITLILFTAALFVHGFTQDILLEAGVFLVSVKLIIMTYKNSVETKKLEQELSEIKDLIKQSR